MPGNAAKVVISERQQEVLRKFSNATTVAKSLSERADIILLAFEGQDNETIADRVGLGRQSVGVWRRRWHRAFDKLVNIECLEPPAALRHAIEKVLADEPRPGRPGKFTTDEEGGKNTQPSPRDRLRELLRQSPRAFGKPRSIWTIKLLAEVCFETGIVDHAVSATTIRRELRRMDIRWRRAKLWSPSPDPEYALKKARRDQLIEEAEKHADWVLGFVDEVWWSRLERPRLSAWTEGDGPPLKMQVLNAGPSDPDPIAICCYGILRKDTKKVIVRFAEDRPTGDITIQFLDWVCQVLCEEGKKKLIVVWDDASWHASGMVLQWIQEHNDHVTKEGGIEVDHFELPARSPWLNDIEHNYRYAKNCIAEPGRKLSAQETVDRVCEHFGCPLLPFLKLTGPSVLESGSPS
jgi:hypothetical protein